MFSAPNNLKFRKFHKIKTNFKSLEQRFFCPKLGDFGLQALSDGKINAKQLEAGRVAIRRFSHKKAFLKISVFPFLGVTKKSTSSRMGKGKGKPSGWVCPVRRGRIIYEMSALGQKFGGN